MAVGKMQVDSGFFQIVVTEEHLNGTQVGARFEQVSGKAMSQRVRVYAFMKTRT